MFVANQVSTEQVQIKLKNDQDNLNFCIPNWDFGQTIVESSNLES